MEKRSLGVIFHRNDFGEADRILHVLTEEHGKIDVIAKGVRKMKAQLGGSVEPFCLADFLILGKSDLKTLRSAQIKESYPAISQNYDYLNACGIIAEVLRFGSVEENDEAELFWLVVHILRLMDRSSLSAQTLLTSFFLRYLYLNGSSIDFIRCSYCNELLSEGGLLNTQQLHTSCKKCAASHHFVGESVEKRHLKLLLILSTSEPAILDRLDLQNTDISHIFLLSKDLIQGFLGRDLQSFV